jgi:hypothetical protein
MRLALSAAFAAILAVAPVLAQQAPSEKPRREAVPPGPEGAATADEAREQIEAAGWHDVAELRKGRAELWHALATKGGLRVRVVLFPDGRVRPED